MGVNSLPKTITRQRRDCDLNPGPSAPKSSMLTTRLPGSLRERATKRLCVCATCTPSTLIDPEQKMLLLLKLNGDGDVYCDGAQVRRSYHTATAERVKHRLTASSVTTDSRSPTTTSSPRTL